MKFIDIFLYFIVSRYLPFIKKYIKKKNIYLINTKILDTKFLSNIKYFF